MIVIIVLVLIYDLLISFYIIFMQIYRQFTNFLRKLILLIKSEFN